MAYYDEKNKNDFEAITKRIEQALQQIAQDESLPPTQTKLAELAGVHRNTFLTEKRKKYPHDLKAIKDKRIARKKIKPVPHATEIKPTTQIDYQKQLQLSREQVVELTMQLSETKTMLRRMQRDLDLAHEDRNRIYKENQVLKAKLERLLPTDSLVLV